MTRFIGPYWLVMGLAYQIIYHGFASPLSLGFWLHVILWPGFVALGMLRMLFFPFAVASLLGLLALTAFSRNTKP